MGLVLDKSEFLIDGSIQIIIIIKNKKEKTKKKKAGVVVVCRYMWAQGRASRKACSNWRGRFGRERGAAGPGPIIV